MSRPNTVADLLQLIDDFNTEPAENDDLLEAINMANISEYLRFDPKTTRAVMLMKEVNLKTFKQEVMKILAFVLVRGTNYNDASKRLSSEAKNEMDRLIAKYGIKIEAPLPKGQNRATEPVNKRTLDPKTVTLNRVASAFPHWTASMIIASPDESPLRKWVRLGGSLPEYLCFPQSPSLVPVRGGILLDQAKAFFEHFDDTINRDAKDSKEDRKRNRDQFFEIIHKSPLYTEAQRDAVIENLKTQHKIAATKVVAGTVESTVRDLLGQNQNVSPVASGAAPTTTPTKTEEEKKADDAKNKFDIKPVSADEMKLVNPDGEKLGQGAVTKMTNAKIPAGVYHLTEIYTRLNLGNPGAKRADGFLVAAATPTGIEYSYHDRIKTL